MNKVYCIFEEDDKTMSVGEVQDFSELGNIRERC